MNEAAEVLLKYSVHHLRLAIGLRVVRRAESQSCAA